MGLCLIIKSNQIKSYHNRFLPQRSNNLSSLVEITLKLFDVGIVSDQMDPSKMFHSFWTGSSGARR